MISSLGGGMGMPSMDAVRQMQQRAFSRADANASGGLDSAEFGAMLKSSPMGGVPGGMDSGDTFKKVDGNGDGQLTQAELTQAREQMMERFQSTMQLFGSSGTAAAGRSEEPLKALLAAIGNGDGTSSGQKAGRATREPDSEWLSAQMKVMMEKLASSYGSLMETQPNQLALVA